MYLFSRCCRGYLPDHPVSLHSLSTEEGQCGSGLFLSPLEAISGPQIEAKQSSQFLGHSLPPPHPCLPILFFF